MKENCSYTIPKVTQFRDLEVLLMASSTPVLLVEGIRKLPTEDHALLVKTGTWLAKQLPSVKFRSGNADGSDTAFAEGVCAVDPKRMEYVIPAEGSGRKRRMSAARSVNLTELPKVAETRIEEYTATASPDTKGLIE